MKLLLKTIVNILNIYFCVKSLVGREELYHSNRGYSLLIKYKIKKNIKKIRSTRSSSNNKFKKNILFPIIF